MDTAKNTGTRSGRLISASLRTRVHECSSAVKFLILALATSLPLGVRADDSQIKLELTVPYAETHVLGDPIPLVWSFSNHSTNPLAFMWEGCCRLNGRLKVTGGEGEMVAIPPGAATAHQFAKAIRVAPGKAQEFITLVSDWIVLKETGDYQLAGQYRGVLPEQRPQVPRGVELWRGEALAAAVPLKVLRPETYLKQRADRSARRQLALELSGPATVTPLKTNALVLKISNPSAQPQKLNWPGALQLWILNAAGTRLANAATALEAAPEELNILPGTSITRELPLAPGLFEGEAFAEYDLFIDLAADGTARPRLPSNDLSVHWRIGTRQVAELLSAAAQGSKTGLRNAPLKWLRTYVAELRGALEEFTPSTPQETALAKELVLASRLKPFAPNPGLVNLTIAVDNQGWRFADQPVAEIFGDSPNAGQLYETLAVRRHLGWDVAVNLRPGDHASMSNVFQTVDQLALPAGNLAAPLRALVPLANATVPGSIQFQTNFARANVVVRLVKEGGRIQITVARKLPDPQKPQLAALFSPEELKAAAFTPATDGDTLDKLVNDGAIKSPQVFVVAAANVHWSEIVEALTPLMKRGVAVDLSMGE